MSAWLLSHLEQFPPEGFLMQRGFLPSGLNPRVGQLMCKCHTVSKSTELPLYQQTTVGAAQSQPEQVQGTESPDLGLALFLAPPPQSVPKKLLLFPKPVQLEGWERKTRLSDLPKGLPETGVGNRL